MSQSRGKWGQRQGSLAAQEERPQAAAAALLVPHNGAARANRSGLRLLRCKTGGPCSPLRRAGRRLGTCPSRQLRPLPPLRAQALLLQHRTAARPGRSKAAISTRIMFTVVLHTVQPGCDTSVRDAPHPSPEAQATAETPERAELRRGHDSIVSLRC